MSQNELVRERRRITRRLSEIRRQIDVGIDPARVDRMAYLASLYAEQHELRQAEMRVCAQLRGAA
jgi:hypothetical protein